MTVNTPQYWLIIPAGGIGSRFNADLPKQYLTLNNQRSVFDQTLETLLSLSEITGAVVAINEHDQHFQHSLYAHHPKLIARVNGGNSRQQSVLNALQKLSEYAQGEDWVLVHDAVRPCINQQDVIKLMTALTHNKLGGLLAVPVVDTLKKYQENKVLTTLKRQDLWQAQTPQMYRFNKLITALNIAKDNKLTYTDESQAIENAYPHILTKIIKGNRNNIKITYAEDLALANFYLSSTPS